MGEYERVPIADWQTLVDHLREFADEGELSESNEGVEITVGSARFSVTHDGEVSAGMPLHDFEDADIDVLYFDHERGRIRVESGNRSYEFRRPS